MKRIVVAESSPTIKNVADNLLRQSGYDVVCTSDGLQALEVIKSEKPDLVMVGLNLSGITGLELCRQMAGDSAVGGIPIVVMVGSKDNVHADDLISSGVRGKLQKPFSPRDLLTVVKKLIGDGEQENQKPGRNQNPKDTKYKARVLSTTRHLDGSPKEVYNLDWTSLNSPGKGQVEIVPDDTGLPMPEEDDEISIDQNQFDLESLNAENEEQAPAKKESSDEDYDWFIGEMKKEGEGQKDVDSQKDIESQKKQNEPKAKTKAPAEKEILPDSDPESDSEELKFEDFGPPNAKDAQAQKARKNNVPAPTKTAQKKPAPAPAAPKLTDADISSIADQVAKNLASTIAASIDRQMILDAIKSITKQ